MAYSHKHTISLIRGEGPTGVTLTVSVEKDTSNPDMCGAIYSIIPTDSTMREKGTAAGSVTGVACTAEALTEAVVSDAAKALSIDDLAIFGPRHYIAALINALKEIGFLG